MNEDGLIAAPKDALALDFANTRYWRGRADPHEDLREPADLLKWLAAALPVTEEVRQRIEAWWRADPVAASDALTQALSQRETIFRIFSRTADAQMPVASDLSQFQRHLAEAPMRRELVNDEGAYGWRIILTPPGVPALLAPVLWSAADLLVKPVLARVHQCANPECQWLFLDDSKSGNRRWCSMSSCGNRAKAHRHYLRKRRADRA